MKRSLLIALIIGFVAAVIIGVLHASGVLLRLELLTDGIVSHDRTATRSVGNNWHYFLVVLLAVGVSWLTLTSARRGRFGVLALILLVELAGVSWVCSLYGLFFQPLPSILAVALAFVIAEGWIIFSRRTRSHLATAFFANHLSRKQVRRMIEGEIPLNAQPRAHDATVVVCDIANKYDLAEESA